VLNTSYKYLLFCTNIEVAILYYEGHVDLQVLKKAVEIRISNKQGRKYLLKRATYFALSDRHYWVDEDETKASNMHARNSNSYR
jgi:hypothetical protein